MRVMFSDFFPLFPCLIACLVVGTPGHAAPAPRGSDAWCKQMMDKPKGLWSLNDQDSWDAHCKKQQEAWWKRWKQRQFIDEDDNAFARKMFSHDTATPSTGTKPPG